jgi:type VI secretion system protein ImpK
LALLFQGVFTAIVRIQSGKQPVGDLDVFRRRMKSALQEAERDAITARYSTDEVTNAQFAMVALLDESILSSKDPVREEWRKKTLNVEMFGEANAGEVFFDRLQGLVRRDESPRLADILEVYLLCLLLGFEGRFGGAMRGEALVLAERVRRRIEAIRGMDYQLSPRIEFSAEQAAPSVAVAADPNAGRLRWLAYMAGGLLLLFVVYKLHLVWRMGALQEFVNR